MSFSCACLSRCAPSASRLTGGGRSLVDVDGIWAVAFRRFRGGKCASTSAAIVAVATILSVALRVLFLPRVVGFGVHTKRPRIRSCTSEGARHNPKFVEKELRLFVAKRRFPRFPVDCGLWTSRCVAIRTAPPFGSNTRIPPVFFDGRRLLHCAPSQPSGRIKDRESMRIWALDILGLAPVSGTRPHLKI